MTDQPQPTPDPDPRTRHRLVAGGIGVAVVAALAGGGAFAYSQLSGGGTQPHDVLPAAMEAYARIDLDPSAGQKVQLFRLLRKVPDAAKELGDPEKSDLRQLVVEDLLADACEDVDYDRDVEPWLGERIGFGADLGDETFLVAAQVTDEAEARAGVDALSTCAGEEIGLAFLDGYALLSDSQKTVDDAIEETAEGSLGDRKEFADAMDELGEQGIASAWVDGEAVVDALPALGVPTEELGDLEQLENVGTAAFALRVDGSAIELAGVGGLTDAYDVDPAPIGDLPADTVVAASLSGLGGQVGPQYERFLEQISSFADVAGADPAAEPAELDPEILAEMDPETRELYEQYQVDSEAPGLSVEDQVEAFEEQYDIALPEDLETLLGDSITLAIGRSNLDTIATLAGPEDVSQLDLAVRTQGDAAKTKAVMDKLAGFAEDAGVPLVSQQTDDGAALATNAGAAEAVTGGGKLGDEGGFQAVLPYGEDSVQAVYVDVAAIIDAIRASDPPPEVLDGIEQVEALAGVGFSAAKVGDDRTAVSLRVAFAD